MHIWVPSSGDSSGPTSAGPREYRLNYEDAHTKPPPSINPHTPDNQNLPPFLSPPNTRAVPSPDPILAPASPQPTPARAGPAGRLSVPRPACRHPSLHNSVPQGRAQRARARGRSPGEPLGLLLLLCGQGWGGRGRCARGKIQSQNPFEGQAARLRKGGDTGGGAVRPPGRRNGAGGDGEDAAGSGPPESGTHEARTRSLHICAQAGAPPPLSAALRNMGPPKCSCKFLKVLNSSYLRLRGNYTPLKTYTPIWNWSGFRCLPPHHPGGPSKPPPGTLGLQDASLRLFPFQGPNNYVPLSLAGGFRRGPSVLITDTEARAARRLQQGRSTPSRLGTRECSHAQRGRGPGAHRIHAAP